MTHDRLAQALRPFRGASVAQPQGAVRVRSPEPMDENALAQEIARIMERPCSAPRQPCWTTHSQWLGDEADRALVEHYEVAAVTSTHASARGEPDSDHDIALDAITVNDEMPSSNFGAGTATQWVRQARRDRFRRKVRNALGWTVSLAVSILLVAAAGLAMYGWPQSFTAVRQSEVKSLKVSTARQPGYSVPAYASGVKAWQEQLATAEPGAGR